MANQKRVLSSPTSPMPLRPRNSSPSPPAARSSSPLSSGSLISYPVTTASFQSSPDLPDSDNDSQGSPDYLDPFKYTSDMECDFRRIDAEAAQLEDDGPLPSSNTEFDGSLPPPSQADPPLPTHDDSSPPPRDDLPPPTHVDPPLERLRCKQKTWVVFRGKEPGIYDSMYGFHSTSTRPACPHISF